MDSSKLTLDDRDALVRIIRRAAQRGREMREQNETADLGELGGQTQDGGGTPDLQRVGSTTRSIVDER
jgi:hypothetical protein